VNLDSVLLTVKAQHPKRFKECLRLVNLALKHREKRIVGFAPAGRLVVEGLTEAGKTYQHPIELLSSGEKQVLLMIGFAVAFLRPGGILLIDEPDLHLHISMIAQLMETLELIVQDRDGQLIVASHSSLVWDWFSSDEERIELGPWRGIPHDVSA
jgi:predicted ATPase